MPPQEVESFRQLVSTTLPMGSNIFWTRWKTWISVSPKLHIELFEGANDLRDGEIFPRHYYEPLRQLWMMRASDGRGNVGTKPLHQRSTLSFSSHVACCRSLAVLIQSLVYFFSGLDRLFSPDYVPTVQDIVRTRARTIGITETAFQLRDGEMLMIDVGGQKSERRKWIDRFQDVTSILFFGKPKRLRPMSGRGQGCGACSHRWIDRRTPTTIP